MASVRIQIAFLFTACIGASLAGCGDDASSDVASAATSALSSASGGATGQIGASVGTALTISGSAPPSVAAGGAYRFLPTAKDSAGAVMSFSIKNTPAWATFDTTTGLLTGTPTGAHVGGSPLIVISVSDGTLSASLPAFSILVTEPLSSAPAMASSPITPARTTPATTAPAATAPGSSTAPSDSTAPGKGAPPTAPAPTAPTTPTAPRAPADAVSISGSPALSVAVGAAYSFHPAATDSAGRTVAFAVANLPSWAKFDPSSGTISGTPAAVNVGKSAPVAVSVSDGIATATLAPFVITVEAASATAQLTWVAPSSTTTGSAPQLAGYHVYYGPSANSLTQVVDVAGAGSTSYTLNSLAHGTWYFAVTAYNTAHVESSLSAVVPVSL